ncbi:unnamed protein product [Penicillium crustosum]
MTTHHSPNHLHIIAISSSLAHNLVHTTIGCGKQGFPSAQPYLSHTPKVRLHALIIGAGLRRNGAILKVVAEVIREARSRSILFLLDVDGLLIGTEDTGVVKGHKNCILTSNVVEYGRLAKALGIDVTSPAEDNANDAQSLEEVQAEPSSEGKRISPATTLLLTTWAGNSIMRECSRWSFKATGRSMQASDLTGEVPGTFLKLIGEPEETKTSL